MDNQHIYHQQLLSLLLDLGCNQSVSIAGSYVLLILTHECEWDLSFRLPDSRSFVQAPNIPSFPHWHLVRLLCVFFSFSVPVLFWTSKYLSLSDFWTLPGLSSGKERTTTATIYSDLYSSVLSGDRLLLIGWYRDDKHLCLPHVFPILPTVIFLWQFYS